MILMMTKSIMFVDRSKIYQHTKLSESFEFCTILNHKQYTMKLFHEPVGIGMSDKYTYITQLEVYDKNNIITDIISKQLLDKRSPVTEPEEINTIIEWIYKNA